MSTPTTSALNTQPTGSTPAGWYPQADGTQRYWDGSQWTEHLAHPGAGTPVPPPFDAAATTEPAKKGNWFGRHKVITGLGSGVVAIGLISALSGGGSGSADASAPSVPAATASAPAAAGAAAPKAAVPAPTTAAPKASAPAEAAKAAAGLNTPVTDGKFEFTVTGVEGGKTQIGDQYLNTKAQGQFVVVSLSVKNIGDKAQTIYDGNLKAFDASGKEFSADSKAQMYLGDEGRLWINEINPGNSVKGQVVFDVPKGTQLTTIELHDSMFSGGATVNLK